MLKRFAGRGSIVIGATTWIILVSCGSSDDTSSFGGNNSDGGTGGGDGGTLGGDGGTFGGDGGSIASGAPTTCIVGTQGCLCDSTGGCAPPLTCTPQTAPAPNLCCNGTDCSSVGGTIGKSCSTVSGAPSCAPGITTPPATLPNDNCGYPSAGFRESTTICGVNASGGGTSPAIIQVFYNDEHALTLGCTSASYSVEPLSSDPDAVHYPNTGDPGCTDTLGRPLRPVVFVTDISNDSSCNAGDMQQGGPAYDPVAIFGTWKSATEDTDGSTVGLPTADPLKNNWDLTTSADPVPASAMTNCKEGYGTELRYEVGLISGHSYRIQVIEHDGDQNKGGDSGENCVDFCAGTGTLCDPGVTVCADGTACPSGTSCVQGCCLNIPR
ncbi:MAG: hypothetical protein ACRELY_07695 [Polyangiaceae bacterium]